VAFDIFSRALGNLRALLHLRPDYFLLATRYGLGNLIGEHALPVRLNFHVVN